jgi:hypothetical protein
MAFEPRHFSNQPSHRLASVRPPVKKCRWIGPPDYRSVFNGLVIAVGASLPVWSERSKRLRPASLESRDTRPRCRRRRLRFLATRRQRPMICEPGRINDFRARLTFGLTKLHAVHNRNSRRCRTASNRTLMRCDGSRTGNRCRGRPGVPHLIRRPRAVGDSRFFFTAIFEFELDWPERIPAEPLRHHGPVRAGAKDVAQRSMSVVRKLD